MRVSTQHINQDQEDSLKVQNSRATRTMKVTVDGKNLVSHAGTALLSELADRSGLTDAMSEAMTGCGISWHTHDPGVVLTPWPWPSLMVPTAWLRSEESAKLARAQVPLSPVLFEGAVAVGCSYCPTDPVVRGFCHRRQVPSVGA
jgi:hypothetical protein